MLLPLLPLLLLLAKNSAGFLTLLGISHGNDAFDHAPFGPPSAKIASLSRARRRTLLSGLLAVELEISG